MSLDVSADQVGLGMDIVEIDRMRKILARTPSFARRVFSDEERAYCDASVVPEVHYATRFAAKEAVVKALGTGFSAGINVRDIEVKRTAKGRPYVVLTGRAREIARETGVREIPISLSFTHVEAVACAMAITEDAVAATNRRTDPTEELAKQFKEARAMLDDLPGKSPDDAPGEVPAEAPGEAPGDLPDDAPGEAPGDLPAEAPDEEPDNLPENDLGNAPENEPDKTYDELSAATASIT